MSTARVLVVDDSATVRAVLKRMLSRSRGLEVIGEARDGREAVEAASRLRPDAVIMDIEMPEVDGFSATRRIMEESPTAVIVLSSRVKQDEMRTAFEAIRCGAVGVLPKPETPAEWETMETILADTVRAIADRTEAEAVFPEAVRGTGPDTSLRYLGVGASTGGPASLRELLAGLGPHFELGVAVVQHISQGFEIGMADWLARELGIDIRVACQGEVLSPGAVRIAPYGGHLKIDGEGRLEIDRSTPAQRGHRPSADELLLSLARHWPTSSAGVLLSGMGDDGARGLARLREAGGFTAVQDEASCAVFGMPRAALELEAAEAVMAPGELGRLLADADHCGAGEDSSDP